MRWFVRLGCVVGVSLLACTPPAAGPVRLVVEPSSLSLAFAESQTVTASAFTGTRIASLQGLTWSSDNELIVGVSAHDDGTATLVGLQPGTVVVTARLKDASASVNVTVAPRVVLLERIELTPETPSVPRGLRLQLHATGTYSDGSTKDLTNAVAWASADGAKATVTANGLVTGVSVGTVEVRALKDGFTARTTLSVTAATVVGIDVRPGSLSLPVGTSQVFSATVRLSDTSTMDVTTTATWASSDVTRATVDSRGKVTAVATGPVTLTATVGATAGSASLTISNAVLRGLDVAPVSSTLPVGSTLALTVMGRFSDGTQVDVTSRATWRSGTTAVASVDAMGVVTATGLGLAVISATVDGLTGNASVTGVAAQLVSLSMAPQTPSLPLGASRALTCVGTYTDQSTRDLTSALVWSTSDASLATVSTSGVDIGQVHALAEGQVTITATNGTLSATSMVTVTAAALVSVRVTPPTVSVPAGLSRQLTASGTFSDGSQRDVTASVTWSSNTPAVATVSNAVGSQGLLTAVTLGNATLSATSGSVSGVMIVDVIAPVLQRIDVTGPAPSLAKGRTQQLTATGVYSDGSQVDLTSQVTFGPTAGPTFTVSSTGLLTAIFVGTANATATLGAITGSAPFTVTLAELVSIAVTPTTPMVPLGLTQQLVATGTYSDNSTRVITPSVAWSTVGTTVASVSSQGLVSTVAQGTETVTATLSGISGSVTVTVAAPALTSITLTPATPSIDKTQTVQLSVTGHFSDGTTAPLTTGLLWSSTLPGVATVDTSGLVTGVVPGVTSVSATSGTVSGSTLITVNRPALSSLSVTPGPSVAIDPGSMQAFVATATYVDSSTEVVTALVSWASSSPAVATISPLGVATALSTGTTIISATWQSVTATVTLDVNAVSLVSIAITGRTVVAVGSSTKLVATGTWSDAHTSDLTLLVTWASASPSTVALTNLPSVFGVARGVSAGSTTVTATLGAVSSPAFSIRALDTNTPYTGRCGPGLVISQVYGGGGNTGATWRNDFVELHNPTEAPIALSGFSIQYAGATGTSWLPHSLPNTSVPPGGYFLIQLASGGANGAVLPTFDQAGSINMGAAAGKVALVVGTATIGAIACPTANIADFVGYGSTASCFEGTAPAPAPGASTWLVRGSSGCRDGNQGSTDFTTTTTVNPRSLSSSGLLCSCSVNGSALAEELNSCQLLGAANLNVTAGTTSGAVPALVTQPGLTDTAGFDSSLIVQTGFGPAATTPAVSGWQWWPASGSSAGLVSDEYSGVFVAPSTGTYGFTSRASRDGVNWTACDLNGAGSGSGLALEVGQLGILVVP